ncbi:MAG: 3'(2'),5'-bisphosphate nucleotidase CysQ [Myxococcales bacterium]|nr:3'(2'),5'-bisphosphate nucleotidase CysQ [Myxococcales bacterium]MCB9548851.1 3'(2'),5'-bisphosphate nucleotidase CysQ [Myxococcales bacterium]
MSLAADLDLTLALAAEAAAAIHAIYDAGFEVRTKGDGSPVTVADEQANALILEGLRKHRPHDAVLSEEAPYRAGSAPGRLWMVDPLDGTADFADRTGDFAVMIGLAIDGRPAVGVVAAPALGRTFAGVVGEGAFELVAGERRPLVGPTGEGPLRVLTSRKHPPADLAYVLAHLGEPARIPRGSVGIKTGLVAAGEADLYLHPTRGTHWWDCCAPEAIAAAAGLVFSLPSGARVPYDVARTDNPAGVLVAAPSLHARVVDLLAAGRS